MMKDSIISEKIATADTSAPANRISDSQSRIATVSTAKTARLTVAERAYVRGMLALRNRKYAEAHRQLSGYLKLTESENFQTKLICEVLSVYLAISQKIAIIESKVG